MYTGEKIHQKYDMRSFLPSLHTHTPTHTKKKKKIHVYTYVHPASSFPPVVDSTCMFYTYIFQKKKKKCWCLHHADLSLPSTTNMVPTSETPPLSSTCCLHRTFYGTDRSDKSAPLQMDHNGSISASRIQPQTASNPS